MTILNIKASIVDSDAGRIIRRMIIKWSAIGNILEVKAVKRNKEITTVLKSDKDDLEHSYHDCLVCTDIQIIVDIAEADVFNADDYQVATEHVKFE